MDHYSPADVVEVAESEKARRRNDAHKAFTLFRQHYDDSATGALFERDEAATAVADRHNWSVSRGREAVVGLTADVLDPVQHVGTGDTKYVGIIDYQPFDAEGGYGFVEYEDTRGERKNLVCGKCVEQYDYDSEPFRAVEGIGRHEMGCAYQDLLDHLTEHYTEMHESGPGSVEVAASLVSGTTIASSTAVHDGNTSSFSLEDFGATSTDSSLVAFIPDGTGGVTVGQAGVEDHSNLTNINSGAHHGKTTSAVDLTDVSADSAASAHHGKTTSASELSDVSPDSTNNAHHSRYSDSEAASAMSSQGDISLGGSDLTNVSEVRDAGTTMRIEDENDRIEFEDGNNNRADILAQRIYIDNTGNWFEGNHDDLASVGASDHHAQNHDNTDHTTNYLAQSNYNPEADTHSRYSDSEARTAVNGANVNISGDADTVDGKDASQLSAAKLAYYDVGSSATASSGGNRTVRVSGSAYFNLPDGGDATVTLKLIKNNNIIESTSTSKNDIFGSNVTLNPPTFTKTVSLNQGDDLDVFVNVNTSGMSGEPSSKSSNLEIAI